MATAPETPAPGGGDPQIRRSGSRRRGRHVGDPPGPTAPGSLGRGTLAPVADEAPIPGVTLDRRARTRLETFTELLREVAVPRGFVAPSDASRLWERHVADSLRAVPHLAGRKTVADLGSGAGLPGIPVAIVLTGTRVILVEPLRRRAAFLELAIERLGLANAAVAVSRAEELRERVDACVARALAPLERAWTLARPLLRPGGRLVHFAGVGSEVPAEIAGAARVAVDRARVLASAGPLVIITAR